MISIELNLKENYIISKSRATLATRNDRLQCTWMMSFSSVHICIAFRLLQRQDNQEVHAISFFLSEADEMQYICAH